MKRYIRSDTAPVISEGWTYDSDEDMYIQDAEDYRAEVYVEGGRHVRCHIFHNGQLVDSKRYGSTAEITPQLLDRIDSYFTDFIWDSEAAYDVETPKGKYAVDAFSDYGEPVASSKWFDSSEDALRQWFYYESKYPMNAMIQGTGTAEQDIRKFCTVHPELIEDLAKRYNCPYKTDYLLQECAKPAKELKHLDQLHPFGLG